MCSKSVTIRGKEISYCEKGQGQTIVLIHGYLETKEVWIAFADQLLTQFRVICVDIPGHGKSEIISEVHEMDLLALHINGLLEYLKVDKYTIVGHSMGGYVSLALANNFGDKLNGLILFHSSVYADNDEKKNNRQREIDLIKDGKKELILNVNLPKMFANENVDKYKQEINNVRNVALETNDEGICALLRGMMLRKNQQGFVKAFAKPMLFIFGKKDNYIPVEAGEQMLKLNSNIKGEWLEHSGHMGFIEERDKSIQIIYEFVSNL